MIYLYIFLSGGIGCVVRFLISKLLEGFPGFPLGVLFSNLLGTFLIGFFSIVFVTKLFVSHEVQKMCIIGFLGGLTTFSSFTLDSFYLFRDENYLHFVIYFFGNIILGFFLLIYGRFIGKLF